jgi:hypothetical protein
MAERKSGPVKPPIIDLKAREAPGPAAPADESAREDVAPEASEPSAPKSAAPRRGNRAKVEPPTTPAEPSTVDEDLPPEAVPKLAEPPGPAGGDIPPGPPPPPRPPARLAMPWSAISVAAVAGALLGAGLTYLAANWIALPQQDPPFADPTPALGDIAAAITAIDTRLAAVEDTARTTRVSLDATLAQFDAATNDLRQQIAAVEAAMPEPQTVDLTAIETGLQTLEGRVAAIAAGASSDDAAALAQNLTAIEGNLGDLSARLAGLEDRLTAGDQRVATLAADLETAEAAIAAQTRTLGGTEIGPAVKLPLIVSGLESAFATGRPYETELAGLTTLLPELDVPALVATSAADGLSRPDALAARFEAALPQILAGQTAQSSGDLAQDALAWAKALLALRPVEEIEGDTPEAIVSRLEAAMDRRDFAAAATELAQLPPAMQQAAGDVGADIAAHAEAAAFISRLRTEALAPATEPAT